MTEKERDEYGKSSNRYCIMDPGRLSEESKEQYYEYYEEMRRAEENAKFYFGALKDLAAGNFTSRHAQELAKIWRPPVNKTLSYSNLQVETQRYHESNRTRWMGLSDRLEDTLAAMTEDGWILAPRLMKDLRMKRVDPTYYEEFTARVRGGTVLTAALCSRANTANAASTYSTKRAVDDTRVMEEVDSRGPFKRARLACTAEASPAEQPEQSEQSEQSERASPSELEAAAAATAAKAALAARATLAVRAAWGGKS